MAVPEAVEGAVSEGEGVEAEVVDESVEEEEAEMAVGLGLEAAVGMAVECLEMPVASEAVG